MKRIVFLTCIGSLALALAALGAPKSGSRSGGGRGAPSAHAAPMRGGGGHSFARAGDFRGGRVAAPRMRSASAMHRAAPARTFGRSRAAVNSQRAIARANASRSSRAMATTRNAQMAQRNARMAQATRATAGRNLTVNRQRNLTFAHNVAANRAGDTRIVNNWRSDRFSGANYAAFYNYNRPWHDRAWWNNNFTTIVFVSGGWWGWWGWFGGYWYPAWGYDPYAWYPYDGPIYTGYATLTPNRVVVEVQTQLRADGYYAGATDGVMGTQTRAALAAFQADNGLAVTSTIDKPTLQTLGLA